MRMIDSDRRSVVSVGHHLGLADHPPPQQTFPNRGFCPARPYPSPSSRTIPLSDFFAAVVPTLFFYDNDPFVRLRGFSHVKVWSRTLRSEGVTPKKNDVDTAEANARAAFGACVTTINAVDSLSYRFAEVRGEACALSAALRNGYVGANVPRGLFELRPSEQQWVVFSSVVFFDYAVHLPSGGHQAFSAVTEAVISIYALPFTPPTCMWLKL